MKGTTQLSGLVIGGRITARADGTASKYTGFIASIYLYGLNEELGRHRGREGRKECLLCDAECESVSHVLWDGPAYVSIRSAFMLELRRELGDRFEHFQSFDSFEKSSYVLGSEAWGKYILVGC